MESVVGIELVSKTDYLIDKAIEQERKDNKYPPELEQFVDHLFKLRAATSKDNARRGVADKYVVKVYVSNFPDVASYCLKNGIGYMCGFDLMFV